MAQRPWTRDELLIAFSLYCRLPFGQYHRDWRRARRPFSARRVRQTLARRVSAGVDASRRFQAPEGRQKPDGIRPEQMLTASHIIPWSMNEQRRADPCNGLCLCALHDRAFDCGLLTTDENLRVLISRKLEVENPSPAHTEALLKVQGRPLTPPTRYHPDPKALQWHREQVFAG